jgi:dUTP diphosphatase
MASTQKAKSSSATVSVKIKRLSHRRGLPMPRYESDDAAGFDLAAAVANKSPIRLAPGERALIPTGLIFELPQGFEAQVRPRSGLALKHGISVLNSPGTIDSDYRGEVQVLLINLGQQDFTVHRGDRIAQLIIAPVTQAKLSIATTVSGTKRGAGGFGSTGAKTAKPAKRASSRSAAKTTKRGKAKSKSKSR